MTFNDSDAFGVFFFGSSTGVDVSAYGAGAIVFDLLVTDYGSNTTGMTMKIDCFFRVLAVTQALGVVADGAGRRSPSRLPHCRRWIRQASTPDW